VIDKLSASHVQPTQWEPRDGSTWNSPGKTGDMFVRDRPAENQSEVAFRDAARLFRMRQAEAQQDVGELSSNYPNRNGYDENFLGKPLPLPTLSPALKDKVAYRLDQPDNPVLDYTNFSIVMNKDRRQAFFTAVNIDGSQTKSIPRNGEWTIDGRIPRDAQLGNEAYQSNSIDRGHLVRRNDPAWGSRASQASNDTFAYTNASMQHEALNQKEWLALEDHVLGSAKALGQKMTVLTGPIFRDDDPKFDNKGAVKPPTQIPMQFYKVVVWNDKKDGLKAAAFVLSQEDLVHRDRSLFKGDFNPGRFDVYQVPLQELEDMTQMKFGPLGNVTNEPRLIDLDRGILPLV
jgi:endonuclease G